LATFGSVIAEKDVGMTILGSLRESYGGLVIALSTQANLDFPTVIVALLQEKIKRKDVRLNDENPTALFSAGNKGKEKKKSDKKFHSSESNVSKNGKDIKKEKKKGNCFTMGLLDILRHNVENG